MDGAMPDRLRCTQCKKLIEKDKLVEHKYKTMAKRLDHSPDSQFFKPWHLAWGQSLAGRSRCFCGPVEVEQVDEYVLQFEHMIGETT